MGDSDRSKENCACGKQDEDFRALLQRADGVAGVAADLAEAKPAQQEEPEGEHGGDGYRARQAEQQQSERAQHRTGDGDFG